MSTSDTLESICAVHALGGNAFDTWMGQSQMWLRDMLPNSSPFNRARIMTYGYDSTLIKKESNERIKDWADDLLQQIGHGGLVVKEAMIRLHQHPKKYESTKLESCGLLFLSTPHSGSQEADWSQFLLDLSEMTLGVRSHAIVDNLRSFNPLSVDSEEAFSAMPKIPPFHCFCEGNKTSIAGKYRQIVTQASAGFYGQKADKILNVDHHQICKFDSRFSPAYLNGMEWISQTYTMYVDESEEPLSYDIQSADNGFDIRHQLPGKPPIVAPRYPVNENSAWYEGANLRTSSQLVGRTETLQNIVESLQQDNPQPRTVALTGMGAATFEESPAADSDASKTEILLELAFRLRHVTNVFSIKPTDAESLNVAFLQIAVAIGHELLSIRFKNADLASIWRGYNAEERIQAFKRWLAHKNNQPNVFIVDDLDGLCDESLIMAALPSQAQVILYSARDPTILEGLERTGEIYHIPDMEIDEMALLMNATLRKTGSRTSAYAITDVDLESIAGIVSGHALGACRAIAYILNVLSQTSDEPATVFIQSFKGSDWEARKSFLEYKPRLGLSIMETYAVSIERMRPAKEPAMKLLEAMAFLSNSNKSLHFREFFAIKRPWLQELRPDLPDYDVFARGLHDQNEYLLDLERVSIGVRPVVPGPLQIHPLWVECIQQRAEHSGRLRWLRQILLLCHASFLHDPQEYQRFLDPFTRNLAVVATRFNISPRDLCKDDDTWDWFRSSLPDASGVDDNSGASTLASVSSDEDHESASENIEPNEDTAGPIEKAATLREGFETPDTHAAGSQIGLLHQQCKTAASSLLSANPEKLSEEVFAKHLQVYLGLLRSLQNVEDQATAHGSHAMVLEIYDTLIQMAPAFRSRNPMLADLLRKRKEEYKATSRRSNA
ncbi:MAG: hypothetical protein Q9169_008238 [Polycauliona sp. 2 TL-2023]